MKIRFCQKGDYQNLASFLNLHWGNHILANNPKFFQWQHNGTDERDYDFVIAEENGEIHGCLGFISTKRYDSNLTSNNTIWLTNWIVTNSSSGFLGLQILSFLTGNVDHQFIGTVGNNREVEKIYSSLGYNTGKMSHYFRLNPSKKELNLANVPIKIPSKKSKSDDFRSILKRIYLSEIEKLYDFFKIDDGSPGFPRKSVNYIINRYLKHPIYEYKIFSLTRLEEFYGLVVTRECSYRESKALRVIDILMFNEKGWEDLGLLFEDLSISKNYEYVDLYIFGLPEEIINKTGFIELNDEIKSQGVIIPNYFEPFEQKNIEILWAYKHSPKYTPMIFKGDCDQDRPGFF